MTNILVMPMNVFDQCQKIEYQGYLLLQPYLKANFDEYVYVNTEERNELILAFQQNFGDLIAKRNKQIYFIDIKTEIDNKYGNFFLETWSNKKRNTPGWFMPDGGVKADFVYYLFLSQRKFYIIDLPKTREWAFNGNRINEYPEKRQKKYDQLNDTWGRCVPIKDLLKETPCSIVDF